MDEEDCFVPKREKGSTPLNQVTEVLDVIKHPVEKFSGPYQLLESKRATGDSSRAENLLTVVLGSHNIWFIKRS